MRDKESGDGSGYIWDYAKMPPGITSTQRMDLEKTWAEIPKRHTQDIGRLAVEISRDGIGKASYNRLTKDLTVVIGGSDDPGAPASLHHEIHHHMWYKTRTLEQKYEWFKGVIGILLETGKSPTVYSDSYVSFALLAKNMTRYKKLVAYRKNMEQGVVNIDMCYPNYAGLKEDLERDPKWLDMAAYFIYKNTVSKKESRLKKMKDNYDNFLEEEKIGLIKQNYVEMKYDLMDEEDNIFDEMVIYDEVHSETGKYIYAKKFMTEHATIYESKYPSSQDTEQNFGINDGVIDRYVALYHRVFG